MEFFDLTFQKLEVSEKELRGNCSTGQTNLPSYEQDESA